MKSIEITITYGERECLNNGSITWVRPRERGFLISAREPLNARDELHRELDRNLDLLEKRLGFDEPRFEILADE